MRSFRLRIAFAAQVALLVVAYWSIRLTPGGRKKSISWVVGPRETASMVQQLAAVIPRSHSVSLARHQFYADTYDSVIRTSKSLSGKLAGLVRPTVLFARLVNHADGFIYVSDSGFLLDRGDYRRFEFRFLKRHGVKICCYFTGSDIRAPRLMHELQAETGRPNIATQLGLVSPIWDSDRWDAAKRGIAEVADEFADVIYSASVDQLSYLTRPTEAFSYFLSESQFLDSFDKFDDTSMPVVLHAPSSAIIKGTAAVREAVERLRKDGRKFEYVELSGVGNEVVRGELKRAHVVLNQFYAFMPGVFGVEGLASCCAVLMSADERIEPDLPAGSHEAWLVTGVDQVYDHLAMLLAQPALMEKYARAGSQWAHEHASSVASAARLNSVLTAVLDGSYAASRK